MTKCSAKASKKRYIVGVLKNRNFLALWISQVVSQFGDRLAQMGLVGIYLSQTQGVSIAKSVPLIRNLFFFSTLPILIFSPVAGVYVDRWSRRDTLMVTDFLRAGLILLIPLLGFYTKNISYIYIVIFLVFTATCFFNPAKLAFIPNLVSSEQLLAANSLSNITRMLAMIGGVIAGGFIVARLGIRASFLLDSVSFFISGCLIGFIKIKDNPVASEGSFTLFKKIGDDLAKGLHFILENKRILLVTTSLFVLMGAGGIAYVLVTVLITKGLGLGTEGLGIAAASLGGGMILGSLLYGQFGAKLEKNWVILGGTLVTGLFALLLGGGKTITHIAIGVFLVGFVASIIMIASHTLCQETAPDRLRGRVFASLEVIINLSFLVFVWFAGIIGSHYPLSSVFYGIGISLLVYSGGLSLAIITSKKLQMSFSK